jgi:hypothetical protein
MIKPPNLRHHIQQQTKDHSQYFLFSRCIYLSVRVYAHTYNSSSFLTMVHTISTTTSGVRNRHTCYLHIQQTTIPPVCINAMTSSRVPEHTSHENSKVIRRPLVQPQPHRSPVLRRQNINKSPYTSRGELRFYREDAV